ncbi:MAG: L-fuculokinase, partial [Candidatus Brocadiae bacterium]|nr:L-fuculokinase [Candidatus Brocadiia bacterium]
MSELVLVVDCGSTNITSAAVDAEGQLVASAGEPNGTVPQPGGQEGWLITDMDQLWAATCKT